MPHMHWVARQNKLELPNDEEEVNTRDIHKCDGQAHDPDTMAAPLTPKPTRKAEALAKDQETVHRPSDYIKEKEAQGLFSFLPTIEVLSRAMWNLPACKNFLKRQRVCS